jgi:hypothetical protein
MSNDGQMVTTYREDRRFRIADEVARIITARHLQTPRADFHVTSPGEPCEGVADVMERSTFDFMPVVIDEEIIGRCALHAARQCDGPVAEILEPIRASMLVSGDLAIDRLLSHLASDPWLLVVDDRTISGLITPSDLNRQSARVYFYGLLAATETRLADEVRGRIPEDKALARIDPDERNKVEENLAKLRKGDVEPDYVAAFYFRGLFQVAKRSPQIREALGLPDAAWWERRETSLNQFRNGVMHTPVPILTDRAGIQELIDRVDDLLLLTTP